MPLAFLKPPSLQLVLATFQCSLYQLKSNKVQGSFMLLQVVDLYLWQIMFNFNSIKAVTFCS